MLAVFLLALHFSTLITLPAETSAYIPHSPILIDGNGDFTPANGVTSGNGTESDPFIIEGWEIDVFFTGIEVRNTTAYFVVRDVYIYSLTPHMYSIVLFDANNAKVENAIIAMSQNGIIIEELSNAAFVNSSVQAFEACVQVEMSSWITLADNQFSTVAGDCVRVGGSNNVTVSTNNITNFGDMGNERGIFLDHCFRCTVSNNNLTFDSWGTAIWLGNELIIDPSNYINVTGNKITGDGGGQGIWIWLITGRNITVMENTINNTSLGFSCQVGCPGTLLYHNNFISSNEHAHDPGANLFDNGYPSGGNYWDNYTGIDNCSGPNQDNCPDPDGIGDTPYIVDADTRDRYPLMNPVGLPPISIPAPPRDFRASLSGWNLENVSLVWSLSNDDGTGRNSVVGYEIYRNTSFHPSCLGYVLLTALPNGTVSFVDVWAGEPDPSDYFYRVCALDRFGDSTCSEGQAAKFRRSLNQGISFVSIPLIPSDADVDIALQTLAYDRLWLFDSAIQGWDSIDKSKPYSTDPLFIDTTVGFMVNLTRNSNMTIAGVVPSSTTISLEAGWNLIGFPSFKSSFAVSDLKAATAATIVEGFDPLNSPYFMKTLLDGEILQAGMGYWMYTPVQTVWIVDNS